MKSYFFPAHLVLSRIRKSQHNRGPYAGTLFMVPRENEESVRVRLYRPAGRPVVDLPVLFNIHGGGWIFGDCEGVDLQSQYLANHLGCFVVNIDYRLLDEKPFYYPQNEVVDTVEFFLTNAKRFRIDPEKAALAGYSAGGEIVAGAAMLLRDRGVKLCAQILGYPFLDFVDFDFASYSGIYGFSAKLFNWFSRSVLFESLPPHDPVLSPGNADISKLKGLAPAVIISCGAGDHLMPQAEIYADRLSEAGVHAVYRMYPAAEHGFLEHNFKDDPAVFASESEQDRLMRDAVDFIASLDIFQINGTKEIMVTPE